MTRLAMRVVVFVMVLGSVAQAAPKKGDAGGPREAAKEEWRQGNTAYNLGHYDEAVARYEAAYKLVPDAAFLFNIAQSYRQAGKPEQALDRYRAFLRTSAPEDANREIALKLVEDLKEEVKRKLEGKPEVVAPAVEPAKEPAAPAAATAPPPSAAAPPAEPAAPAVMASPPPAPNLVPTAPLVDSNASLTTTIPPAQPSAESPFYKTWWFWTGVGAVVVAGSVTAILLATRSGGGACSGASLTCAEVK